MLVWRAAMNARDDRDQQQAVRAGGEIFGDEVTAAAMIDRFVHHAEIVALKSDKYRLEDRDLAARPPPQPPKHPDQSHAERPRSAAQRL